MGVNSFVELLCRWRRADLLGVNWVMIYTLIQDAA